MVNYEFDDTLSIRNDNAEANKAANVCPLLSNIQNQVNKT